MFELHPQFITENGQNFAVLPYDEFVKIQELLSNFNKKEDLITDNDTFLSLDILSKKIESDKHKALNEWAKVINQLKADNTPQKIEKIRHFLFHDCYELGDEKEQEETLEIIESLEKVSI
ncbi:MAG: hypothetical protein VKJ02_06680 [Snowella sp.]|nr:hypothetical protein [Snowella sp.]